MLLIQPPGEREMKRITGKTVILLLAMGTMFLSACGRKGALMPPEALVPGTVESLRVVQKGEIFEISWSQPSKEQSGRPLRNLAGFRLLKREVLPAEVDCSSCPDSWQLLSSVELDFPGGIKKIGNYFIYLDKGLKSEAKVEYRVLAFSRNGGISRPVTTESRKKVAPPTPPLLKATGLPTAIRLDFVLPAVDWGASNGFNIYRRQPDEQSSPFPINPVPVTSTEWEDKLLQYGKKYIYSATTITTRNGQQVESAPSEEVEIIFTMPELK